MASTTLTADNRNMIIKIAKLFLNSPYEFWWEGTLPGDPTDCSNFTQNILSQVGIHLERASFQQKEQFVNAKSFIVNLAGYRRSHFKWVGALNAFAKSYDNTKAKKNYEKLWWVIDLIPDSYQEVETLKAVNSVIAVLTSTWADLPENFQIVSASYAKSLRETYPKARKLEKDQTKKVYQSLVDFLSYAYKYAWDEEKTKYAELAQFLRNKHKLQS